MPIPLWVIVVIIVAALILIVIVAFGMSLGGQFEMQQRRPDEEMDVRRRR